jgi:hypothetical protein
LYFHRLEKHRQDLFEYLIRPRKVILKYVFPETPGSELSFYFGTDCPMPLKTKAASFRQRLFFFAD